MKYDLGRCLLQERLQAAGMTAAELARTLQYKPERLGDFIENKRVMSLKVALSIADTLGCPVEALYELVPMSDER